MAALELNKCCCDYKAARRLMLVTNMILLIFSIIFIAVGGVSLAIANSFANEAQSYCVEHCALSGDAYEVGCNCIEEKTTIPSIVFQTPSIGLILLGVFSFFTSILGCVGAIRERQSLILAYICLLAMIILLQIVFGAAGAAVANANAEDIEGPLFGVLRQNNPPNYKRFKWQDLSEFFESACYAGTFRELDVDKNTTIIYKHPLCDFDGHCVRTEATEEEEACCTDDFDCNTDNPNCISGSGCFMDLFRRIGLP